MSSAFLKEGRLLCVNEGGRRGVEEGRRQSLLSFRRAWHGRSKEALSVSIGISQWGSNGSYPASEPVTGIRERLRAHYFPTCSVRVQPSFLSWTLLLSSMCPGWPPTGLKLVHCVSCAPTAPSSSSNDGGFSCLSRLLFTWH